LIFAGSSPFTLEQELKGSRNEFIQWIQDVHDQRGILRGYTNYTNEFRTGKNIKQVTHRALQFATSDPKGPVYLVGPREVMEEEVEPLPLDMNVWGPVDASGLAPKGLSLQIITDFSRQRDYRSVAKGKASTCSHLLSRKESESSHSSRGIV
jgi:acetolactate synthase I/II/III large subunit